MVDMSPWGFPPAAASASIAPRAPSPSRFDATAIEAWQQQSGPMRDGRTNGPGQYRERQDYNRRPSPSDDRGRMKRRRSASPDGPPRGDYRRADRYDEYSRGDYRRDDGRDPYYRPEPMRFGGGGGYNSGPRIPAPEDCNYLVPHRHFCDYIEQAYPSVYRNKDRLEEAWQNYRLGFVRKQNVAFCDEHKHELWFREKYDPEELPLRQRVKAQGRAGKVDVFLAKLQEGQFDHLSFDQSYSKLASEKAEGETHDKKPSEMQPDSIQAKSEEKPLNDPKIEPEKENTNDADMKPAITSAPKTEDEDDTKEIDMLRKDLADEMEEEDDPDRETTRRPDDEDEQNAGAANVKSENKEDRSRGIDEWITLPADEWQIVVKAVSADISRTDLEQHCATVQGFDYLALSEPMPSKKFHRVAFVNFKPGTDMNAVEEKLFESKLKDFTLHMNRSNGETKARVRSVPAFFAEEERVAKDLESVQSIVKRFEAESGDSRGSEEINTRLSLIDSDSNSGSHKQNLRTLDLNLQYLRDCFHTCFYCTTICDFPEELTRRCVKHIRRSPETSKASARDASLIKAFDDKVEIMVNPNVDAKRFGGESYDETLHKLCAPHIKIEDEGKFRCRTCTKLFKAENFIEKHVANKHPELLGKALSRIQCVNNYVLDPNRILPNIPTQPPTEPIRLIPGSYGVGSGFAIPMYGDASGTYGMNGHGRLSDRIGQRISDDPPMKRIRRDALPPEGVKLDPRASKGFASYNDLDSTVPSGELELEY